MHPMCLRIDNEQFLLTEKGIPNSFLNLKQKEKFNFFLLSIISSRKIDKAKPYKFS